jgi:pimeloyl-ACP methyl ester carboxylesterase
VIWGLADPAFRPHHLARWTTVLGPAARVVRLPGAGHWPHEEEPTTVGAELGRFLAAP